MQLRYLPRSKVASWNVREVMISISIPLLISHWLRSQHKCNIKCKMSIAWMSNVFYMWKQECMRSVIGAKIHIDFWNMAILTSWHSTSRNWKRVSEKKRMHISAFCLVILKLFCSCSPKLDYLVCVLLALESSHSF